MTWSPDSSTTGGAQTGFTTPTFTLVSDRAPAVNATQVAVSALGGTQGTASANTLSKPFTLSFFRPAVVRQLSSVWDSIRGLKAPVPTNRYTILIRKGVNCNADVSAVATCKIMFDIPAGSETYAPDDIKALASFLVGVLSEESADLGETLLTGVL